MELPIIKNIYTRPMITLSEAKKSIEHLQLMVDIEQQRQIEEYKGVYIRHIL